MEPNWDKLNKLTLEAYELDRAGKLTTEKLDKLESEAEKASGDYQEWRESFARYRQKLEDKDVLAYFGS